MPLYLKFLKDNKYFLIALVIVAIIVLIETYGYAQRVAGEQKVIGQVNTATVSSLKNSIKKGNAAEEQSAKDINKNVSDSQAFDKKQGAVEVGIQKKYTTKKINQVVNGVKTSELVTVPPPAATVPNAMEAEISDSRIDDAWNRYCHFKQQDGQPCEQ